MDNKTKKRKLQGVVVSDKMMKTVVVAISQIKSNAKYLKQYHLTRKFKAHDEKREYHVGDVVVIAETRPMSREKRWEVVSLVKKAITKTE